MLNRLRLIINEIHPSITEEWKWEAPSFASKGLICWTASFKDFVSIHFYKGALISDNFNSFEVGDEEKGSRTIRYASSKEINKDALKDCILQAIEINAQGLKLPKKQIIVEVPKELELILNTLPEEKLYFNSLTKSHQREYTEWISEAKKDETKARRIKKTIELLSAKTTRHAKYKNC